MHASVEKLPAGGLNPDSSAGNMTFALGLAYQGLLNHITFCQQRRITLANNVPDHTIKGLGFWLAAFGIMKALPTDYKAFVDILEYLILVIPVFGLANVFGLMVVSRTVYQDETNYVGKAMDYEATYTGGFGVGHTRCAEILEGSWWKPSTTEGAGSIAIVAWIVVEIVSRYHTLH